MRLPLAPLEVFAAIAQHGSLRAAAEALGIKPSTVSHQLRNLEEQLGTALFIRSTRAISLTEAGRALIRGAGPAFDQLSEAVGKRAQHRTCGAGDAEAGDAGIRLSPVRGAGAGEILR